MTILGHGYLGRILFGFEYWDDNFLSLFISKDLTRILILMLSSEVPPEVFISLVLAYSADFVASLGVISRRLLVHVM